MFANEAMLVFGLLLLSTSLRFLFISYLMKTADVLLYTYTYTHRYRCALGGVAIGYDAASTSDGGGYVIVSVCANTHTESCIMKIVCVFVCMHFCMRMHAYRHIHV